MESKNDVSKFNLNEIGIKPKESQGMDYKSVKEVDMGQWAISTPEKPILATWALASCTGITAYDSEHQFAFLSHSEAMFSFLYNGNDKFGNPSVSAHIQGLVKEINNRKENLNLKFIILPGSYPDKEMVEKIRKNIKDIKSDYITVESIEDKKPFIEEPYENKFIDGNYKYIKNPNFSGGGGSVSIDSRTGKLSSYNSKLNPFHIDDKRMEKMYGAMGDVLLKK